MNWINVDTSQPANEAPVLVYGRFKKRKFISIGKYQRETNWWKTIAECGEFLMIEITREEAKEKVKVLYWMPFPKEPNDLD